MFGSVDALVLTSHAEGDHGIPKTLPQRRKDQAFGDGVELSKGHEKLWHRDRNTGETAVDTCTHTAEKGSDQAVATQKAKTHAAIR